MTCLAKKSHELCLNFLYFMSLNPFIVESFGEPPNEKSEEVQAEIAISGSDSEDESRANLSVFSTLEHNKENCQHTTAVLHKLKFEDKDAATGVIINEAKKKLFITYLSGKNSHKISRAEFYRADGVFITATKEQALAFLKNIGENQHLFNILTNPEKLFYSTLREEFLRVFSNIDVTLEADIMQKLQSFFQQIVQNVNLLAFGEGSQRLLLDNAREVPLLAHGLIARKSDDEIRLLDVNAGVLGRCDYVLKSKGGSDAEPKIFAVFEGKLIRPIYDEYFYRQGGNWYLQIMNSFIGANATVGVAVTAGGLFFMWREEIPDLKSVQHRAGAEIKKYRYLTTSYKFKLQRLDGIPENLDEEIREQYQQEIDDNNDKFLEIFINLARICSSKVDKLAKAAPLKKRVEHEMEASTLTKKQKSSPQLPKNMRATSEENVDLINVPMVVQETVIKPKILWSKVSCKNSNEDLLVGSVQLSEIMSEEELEAVMKEYKKSLKQANATPL
jgi:hypothetical protein